MQHALGRAGGAGRVEDEERILRVHFGRFVGVGLAVDGLVVPEVAPLAPFDRTAGALDREDVTHVLALRGGDLDGGVGVLLQRDRLAAAQALIGGDDVVGGAVDDARGQGVGREAAEDDGMNRADARAGEHGVGGLDDHGHVDRDAIALLDALLQHRVGKAADFAVQLAVADLQIVRRIVALPDDGGLVGAGGQVTVDAVGGNVEGAVFEPFDGDVRIFVGPVAGLGRGVDPVQAVLLVHPEAIGLLDGLTVHGLVLGRVDVSGLGQCLGHGVGLGVHDVSPGRAPASRPRVVG